MRDYVSSSRRRSLAIVIGVVVVVLMVLMGTLFFNKISQIKESVNNAATEVQHAKEVGTIAESRIPIAWVLGQRGSGFELRESTATDYGRITVSRLTFKTALTVPSIMSVYEEYFQKNNAGYLFQKQMNQDATGGSIVANPQSNGTLKIEFRKNSEGKGTIVSLVYEWKKP
jgi:hypothetical protein